MDCCFGTNPSFSHCILLKTAPRHRRVRRRCWIVCLSSHLVPRCACLSVHKRLPTSSERDIAVASLLTLTNRLQTTRQRSIVLKLARSDERTTSNRTKNSGKASPSLSLSASVSNGRKWQTIWSRQLGSICKSIPAPLCVSILCRRQICPVCRAPYVRSG